MSVLDTTLGLAGGWHTTACGSLWVRAALRTGDERPPVLFVHGLGRGGGQLVPLAAAFRGVRSVLVPDLFDLGGRSRGRGRTLTIPEHAEVLGELLEQHGPAEVVGISLGGWVAAWLAAQRPELVHGLYLVNPAGTREDAEALGDLYRETARGGELYRRVVASRPFLGVPVVSALLERGFLRVLQTPDVRALIDGIEEHHFIEHALPRITCRVRLLLSESDLLLRPAATLQVWTAGVRDLEGLWVAETSHNLGYEAFEVLLDDLAGYLGMRRAPASWIATVASHLRVPPRTRPLREEAR